MGNPPRHLAEDEGPARGTGLLLTGLLLLAGAGAFLLLRDDGPGGGAGASSMAPATSATAPPAAAATTSTRAEAPGSLIDGGGFEAGLAGLQAAAGTAVGRVAPGESSGWAARLSTTASRPAPVAVELQDAVTAPPPGAVYTASVWVRASKPGVIAEVKLAERRRDGQASSDAGLIHLADTRWHQIGVRHRVAAAGSALDLEVEALSLEPGQALLIDHLELVRAL